MSTHRDERIVATHQRWAARGMAILFVALAIDLIVRSLILKQDPRQYLDIGLIWLATVLYVAIGMTASGVAPYEGKWSKSWLVILTIVVTNTVVLTLMVIGEVHTWAHLIAIITFGLIGGGASVFLALRSLRGIYARWERRTFGRGPRDE